METNTTGLMTTRKTDLGAEGCFQWEFVVGRQGKMPEVLLLQNHFEPLTLWGVLVSPIWDQLESEGIR